MSNHDNPPQGIGGWLILVAAGVIIAPINLLVGTFLSNLPIFADDTWSLLTDPESPVYVPWFGPLAVLEIVANLGFVFLGFTLIFLFFKKSDKFPATFVVVLLLNLVYLLVDAWLGGMVFPANRCLIRTQLDW
jgi:hypothetical protein